MKNKDCSYTGINQKPRVFSLATVVVNLPMSVPAMPQRGSTVIASSINSEVGGAFNVMAAITRQGVSVINASPLGTGPNSMLVRRELYKEKITSSSIELVGDTGTKLIFIEKDGHNTSILSPGVEAEIDEYSLHNLALQDGDYIYISAGDLVFSGYCRAVSTWLATLDKHIHVVMAASPLIDGVSRDSLQQILPFVDLLTMNRRERRVLMAIMGLHEDGYEELYHHGLPHRSSIIYRNGDAGCDIFSLHHPCQHIPSLPSTIVDTTGVGDAHTGVCIASLASGCSLAQATWRGNVAGAMVIAKHGSATCPTSEDIDQILLNVGEEPHIS